MASTTQTTYYGLPQYIGSDRASWLDTNEPFATIDTAIHTAVTGVEQATSDVASLREDVAQAQLDVSALDGRMDTAELNIGQLQTTVAGHTGDIADVRRDLQDNIESLREETATSTHAYEIGDYFYYNDVLFKATAQIAIGATIVPNTNCTGVTVMDELKNVSPTPGVVTASDVSYDNTTSGLTADDVQDALDEINSKIARNVPDIEYTAAAAMTGAQILAYLRTQDLSKLTPKSVIGLGGLYHHCGLLDNNVCSFYVDYIASGNVQHNIFTTNFTDATSDLYISNTGSIIASEIITSGKKIEIFF